jgi:hypothetical protein
VEPLWPPRRRFRRLYLISTYVIGKERLLLEISARTGLKICVTARKHEVLRLCLRDAHTRGPHGGPLATAAAAGAAAGLGRGGSAGTLDGEAAQVGGPVAAAGGSCAGGGSGAGAGGRPADADEAAAEALLARCFTTDPSETPVHVVEWGALAWAGLDGVGQGWRGGSRCLA